MLEKFTSDDDPKKSILEFLAKRIGRREEPPKIKMGIKDWNILRKYSWDVLDMETSLPIINSGVIGYLWGSSIHIEDRHDIVVDSW